MIRSATLSQRLGAEQACPRPQQQQPQPLLPSRPFSWLVSLDIHPRYICPVGDDAPQNPLLLSPSPLPFPILNTNDNKLSVLSLQSMNDRFEYL